MSRRVCVLLTIVILCYAAATCKKPAKEKDCKDKEVWSSCCAACENACGFPDGKRCLHKVPGCVCQEGLVRNQNGDCIDPKDCGDERRGPVLFPTTT